MLTDREPKNLTKNETEFLHQFGPRIANINKISWVQIASSRWGSEKSNLLVPALDQGKQIRLFICIFSGQLDSFSDSKFIFSTVNYYVYENYRKESESQQIAKFLGHCACNPRAFSSTTERPSAVINLKILKHNIGTHSYTYTRFVTFCFSYQCLNAVTHSLLHSSSTPSRDHSTFVHSPLSSTSSYNLLCNFESRHHITVSMQVATITITPTISLLRLLTIWRKLETFAFQKPTHTCPPDASETRLTLI